MSNATMFSVYGRLTAHPGRRDELIALLHEGFRAGGDGSGLLTYTINTVPDEPDTIWMTQLWADKEAHDATTRSAPVAAVSQRLPALLATQPEGSYGHAVYVHDRTAA
jgi:quinol monooxygenase YgiN